MSYTAQHAASLAALPLVSVLLAFWGCSKALILEDIPAGSKPGEHAMESGERKIDGKSDRVDEGSLIVTENPDDPHSRKIALPLVRIRSSNPKPAEPVFWLGGGPGMSNMGYEPPAPILENHDVVLVGYRGVDGSTVLGSDEMIDAVKGTEGDLLGEQSLKSISEALDRFRTKVKERGVDLSHYTITEVISDLESARKALAYDRIHLLSASYGTRVALLYGYLHPESIARSVMVGVNPPGRFVWDPGKIDEQLAHYAALAPSDPGKTWARSIATTMRTALRNMPDRWSGFKLNAGKIKVASFVMLYHKKTASIVFDSFRAASEGDYGGLYLLQLAYDYMIPRMIVWGEFFAKGLTADYDASIDYRARLDDSSTVMGSPLARLIWWTGPGHWPFHTISEDLRTVQRSTVQTLLVSGSIDFSTPAEYATDELLPSLPNGRQVIVHEMGHVDDLMNLQPDAFGHMMKRYFDEGVVDESRFVYDPVSFEPPIDLPFWAKALFPLVAIASWL